MITECDRQLGKVGGHAEQNKIKDNKGENAV